MQPPSRSSLGRFLSSSIGRKVLMALTGIGLLGFLVGHVSGNLLIFSGRDALNSYAQWLKDNAPLVWTARIGLIVIFALHIRLAFRLRGENQQARPVAYASPNGVDLRWNAKSMMMTGGLILAFVVYHLLHFTFGAIQSGNYALLETIEGGSRHDVYGMVIAGFSHPLVAISYLVAMGILFAHLSHGVASFFQTLGLHHKRYQPIIQKASFGLSGLIVVAYVSIPLSILFGFVKA